MKMIPAYLGDNSKSKAESLLFDELKQLRLPDDAVCLHTVNLPEHRYKICGEIDFLIVGTAGLLVLEVKGGGVSRHEGIWTYQDRWGNKHHNSEEPFNQASSAMFSLMDRVVCKILSICIFINGKSPIVIVDNTSQNISPLDGSIFPP